MLAKHGPGPKPLYHMEMAKLCDESKLSIYKPGGRGGW